MAHRSWRNLHSSFIIMKIDFTQGLVQLSSTKVVIFGNTLKNTQKSSWRSYSTKTLKQAFRYLLNFHKMSMTIDDSHSLNSINQMEVSF